MPNDRHSAVVWNCANRLLSWRSRVATGIEVKSPYRAVQTLWEIDNNRWRRRSYILAWEISVAIKVLLFRRNLDRLHVKECWTESMSIVVILAGRELWWVHSQMRCISVFHVHIRKTHQTRWDLPYVPVEFLSRGLLKIASLMKCLALLNLTLQLHVIRCLSSHFPIYNRLPIFFVFYGLYIDIIRVRSCSRIMLDILGSSLLYLPKLGSQL